MARYGSGIAVVILSNSHEDAGRIVMARLALPAPRITAGLAGIFPSVTAVPRIVRSSP